MFLETLGLSFGGTLVLPRLVQVPFEGGSGVRGMLLQSCCCEAWEICDVVVVQGLL